MRKCSNCYHAEDTYPLDPHGSLYCEIVEEYVCANKSCDEWKALHNAVLTTAALDSENDAVLENNVFYTKYVDSGKIILTRCR